jgi:PAS domain S-box-containing protein
MVIKAMQAGVQDYLIKGQVDGRLLRRVIQHAIQRKQIEMQLADALAFNEQVLTASPVGILTYKFTGECVSANACVAQMVGATVEQLKQQNFRNLDSWKRSGLYEMAERAIASKQLVAGDVHVISTFGKEVWLRAQFVTFKSGGEELLLLTFGDITERKQAEAALEANEKRFRSWIEYSSDIVTIVDSAGIIQYESPSIKRLLGYLPEELLGKNAFSFLHSEDRARIMELFAENVQNPQDAVTAEFRFRHHDGSWRFLEAIGQTHIDEHGEWVVLINSRDTTERKKAEEAMAAMQKRLQQSEATLRGFYESAPSLMGITELVGDDDILHIYDNPATCRFFCAENDSTK